MESVMNILSTLSTGAVLLIAVVRISESMRDASVSYTISVGLFTLLSLAYLIGLGFKSSLGL